ncbi:hypothetical protein [uncultured Tateyamaria sp.]|uniref:hypothetical protein n=1 Tax=uncultured Tateyamaria sp. TaxID=455651 RepID=UPI0026147102|nr:hypothetical protein [uncultured Tateyamaria sp.]
MVGPGGDPTRDHGGFGRDGFFEIPGIRLVALTAGDEDFEQIFAFLDDDDRVLMQFNRRGELGAELDASTISRIAAAHGLPAKDVSSALIPGNVWGGAPYNADLNRHMSDVSGVARGYLSKKVAPPVAVEEGRARASHILATSDSTGVGSGGTNLRHVTALTPVTGFMLSSGLRGGGNTVFVPASAGDLAPAVEAVDGPLGTTGLATAMQMMNHFQNADGGERTVWTARSSGLSGERLDEIQQGDTQFENAIAELARTAELMAVYDRDLFCETVYLNCGTNDRSASITGAAYAASLRQLLDDKTARIKAVTGQGEDAHLFHWQIAAPRLNEGEASEISRAQLDMGEAHGDIHIIGPSYWVTLNDNVHPDALGHDLKGEYFAKAHRNWKRYGDTRHAPTPDLANIGVAGAVITVPFFTVPRHDGVASHWALTFSSENVAQAVNQGFVINDSGGAAIQSVVISDDGTGGTGTVTITLDQAPASGASLEYAYTGAGAEQAHSQAYGNLVDTDATASLTEPGYVLMNHALSFKEVIS